MLNAYLRTLVLLATSLLFITMDVSAQCRNIAKKQCFPALLPYTQNGQFNSAKLAPGESAEVQMTFYAGQDYRLMVCSEAVLGNVNFKVFDAEKNELFNSKKAAAKQWDFNVAATQALSVQVEIPPSDSPNKIIPEGCVSILVGFKKL